ncbi:site-specific integrase [Butyricicoccus pullicaecorum]|nr:site-specific integrase [Butyricicoccus pullicaecorum]
MAKLNDTGVYQLANKNWAFRYTITADGRKKDVRKAKDEFGNPLKTKTEAIRARNKAVEREREGKKPAPKVRKTFKEVYAEFCENGRKDRAYRTKQKQDSLWNNHLCSKYGKRFVDEITAAEVNDYLSDLYYVEGFSYQYTEAFLKMFYLIFGQAYSRNYLEVDTYNKLCVNKDTRIKMPKMKTEDDTDIVAFSREELVLLDDYFKGTNAETAYLLGRYCGLRINEAFGLKWENVDLENGTIIIDRQMQYQDGLIKLVSPKTRNSKRTIFLCPTLQEHLKKKFQQRAEDEKQFAELRKQKTRFIDDLDGRKIPSTDLVNCLPDGTLQTVNSMKYPSREIKAKLGINFKYHFLRHTYGTLMAEMNTPTHLLCNQMGHGHIHTTQRYYIAVSKSGIEILQGNLNCL